MIRAPLYGSEVKSKRSISKTEGIRWWKTEPNEGAVYQARCMPGCWAAPNELHFSEKPVPVPGRAEVLVRIDAVAICATDLEILEYGSPALIQGGLPFNKNFTPGHEYMGRVAALGPGVDEYRVGERVTVEIPRRVWAVQAVPAGHVYGLSQLRPELRRR